MSDYINVTVNLVYYIIHKTFKNERYNHYLVNIKNGEGGFSYFENKK